MYILPCDFKISVATVQRGERRGEKGREGERRGEKGREGERRGEKGRLVSA